MEYRVYKTPLVAYRNSWKQLKESQNVCLFGEEDKLPETEISGLVGIMTDCRGDPHVIIGVIGADDTVEKLSDMGIRFEDSCLIAKSPQHIRVYLGLDSK